MATPKLFADHEMASLTTDEVRLAYRELRDQLCAEVKDLRRDLDGVGTVQNGRPQFFEADPKAAPFKISQYGEEFYGMSLHVTAIRNGFMLMRHQPNGDMLYVPDAATVKEALGHSVDAFAVFIAKMAKEQSK